MTTPARGHGRFTRDGVQPAASDTPAGANSNQNTTGKPRRGTPIRHTPEHLAALQPVVCAEYKGGAKVLDLMAKHHIGHRTLKRC
jgi:hypothetical protein